MAFSVEINEKEIFPIIYLKNEEEKTLAEIYAFGALLNAFKIESSINIIDGFASPQNAKENITNGFKSAKLNPFVCRIKEGKYVFNNLEYKIEKFFLGEEAIHGLLYDAIFSIVDSGANNNAAFVTLEYNYSKQDEGPYSSSLDSFFQASPPRPSLTAGTTPSGVFHATHHPALGCLPRGGGFERLQR